MSIEALLSGDTMTVQSPTTTKDSSGAPKRTFADLYTAVPCRVQDASSRVQDVYMMRGIEVKHQMFTQQTGIAPKHLLVASDGRKAIVEGVNFRRAIGSMPDFYVVDAGEFRSGA